MLDEDEPTFDVPRGVEEAVRAGMPPAAISLYSRWWQLETWLRELAYVELRAKYGASWAEALPVDPRRQQSDRQNRYMATADAGNPLAYLDFSKLIELIENNWELFADSLIDRPAWAGRMVEMKQIRNRIGHCRQPHEDDVGRMEQLLRDLQHGAFTALVAYNDRYSPPYDGTDAVSSGWLQERHPDAQRLIQHASNQYDTKFVIQWSHRPWVEDRSVLDPIPGRLWHVQFLIRDRSLNPVTFWHNSYLDEHVRPLVIHVLWDHPSYIQLTFAAVDDDAKISDAIGNAFDAVLGSSRRLADDKLARTGSQLRHLDHRLLYQSAWNIVDESTVPIDIFGVGGGIRGRTLATPPFRRPS